MTCEYDGREIDGEPYKVRMRSRGALASETTAQPAGPSAELQEIGYLYFHDKTCYELFAADESEYEALDLPGSQAG